MNRFQSLRRLHADTAGAEAMEVLLLFAVIVPPVVIATRILWAVLLRFFSGLVAVVNAPIF
jgi:Flp pilus assembly pilin Flp